MEEEKNKLSQSVQGKLERGWECIINQFFDKMKESVLMEGPGMSIFKFLRTPTKEGSNCHYFFFEKEGSEWNSLLSYPQNKEVMERYDPGKNIIVCVQVPIGVYGSDTEGDIRLLDLESKSFIISEVKVEEDEKPISEEEGIEKFGLRRRKSKVEVQ
jgi:hypothetical protein